MSYAVPDLDEVISVARSLGIHLGPDEAVLYRTYLLEHLDALDEFVQSRIEDRRRPCARRSADLAGSRAPPKIR